MAPAKVGSSSGDFGIAGAGSDRRLPRGSISRPARGSRLLRCLRGRPCRCSRLCSSLSSIPCLSL